MPFLVLVNPSSRMVLLPSALNVSVWPFCYICRTVGSCTMHHSSSPVYHSWLAWRPAGLILREDFEILFLDNSYFYSVHSSNLSIPVIWIGV